MKEQAQQYTVGKMQEAYNLYGQTNTDLAKVYFFKCCEKR